MNFSFDAVGVPITMVPSVLEKDSRLHGYIAYALKMCGAYAVPSVSMLLFSCYSLGTADAVQH
jgi:hypothetical protein